MNTEQVPKSCDANADPASTRGRLPSRGKRAKRALRVRQQRGRVAPRPQPGQAPHQSTIRALFLHDLRTADVVKGLKEHSIGFGILRKSAVVAPLRFHSIGQIGYALFAPAAWAKEKENATTLLSRRPVAVSAGGEFNNRFQECCKNAKLTPNLRFSCASFTQVAEPVRSGHAVALLPEMAETSLRGSGVRRF
jgi:DNA-binding transcriptional LysR family regulator